MPDTPLTRDNLKNYLKNEHKNTSPTNEESIPGDLEVFLAPTDHEWIIMFILYGVGVGAGSEQE